MSTELSIAQGYELIEQQRKDGFVRLSDYDDGEHYNRFQDALEVPGLGVVLLITVFVDGAPCITSSFVPGVMIVQEEDGSRGLVPIHLIDQGNTIVAFDAVGTLSDSICNDPELAWAWHCNIVMPFVDEGMEHIAANRAAARFMKSAFGIDMKKNPHFHDILNAE